MQNEDKPESSRKALEQSNGVSAPQLTLPKGGGAIRGIGEKFATNPITGTGSMTVPVYASPGRSGFAPQLTLSYDSGAGNSPFGFGWSLALPSVTRKTDKGLPQYQDLQESDTFILSGAEDLVPSLLSAGSGWARDSVASRTLFGNEYAVHRYRPRVESLFARIERWINLADPQDTFWRSISKDNVTTWYGKSPESRIADPANPSRVFSWLICESYDDKGNASSYEYKAEDSTGVNVSQVNERNRTVVTRSANRYLKRIFYGNVTPYFADLTAEEAAPLPSDWCFELVFDYGEHDLLAPIPADIASPWNCRLDSFSTYRPTFELRTYRLCRRALMFHHFPAEKSGEASLLVRSTSFTHASTPPADASEPFYSFLESVSQIGYSADGAGGYISSSLPPVEFEYSEAVVDETVREVDAASLANVPSGLDEKNYRWADLDGEGLSGILTEEAGGWFYKANLSAANRQTIDGKRYTLPQFAPVELVTKLPSTAALNSQRQQLLSVSGDGQLDLVEFEGPHPGYFERTDDASWASFEPFESLPVIDWRNPELKFVDLTGDGFPDLLVSDGNAFCWYKSLSTDGFASGQYVPQAFDEEQGPKLVFSDGTESIFLADLSGDGLTDLVRIRNGEACYWPNLGYARFGAKVTMDDAPIFDRPDLFDGRRIRLADIDGSGTTDIVYLAGNSVQLYFNQSGNSWGAARLLSHYPAVESVSSATTVDLLGNGTACLVWSSSLAGNVQQPMRYIDLMGGHKPHLLVRVNNNLGAETVVHYAPSTRFYVADKLAGTPWVTRLPFPVQVVESVRTYDYISRNLFIARYAYHHGYFDGVEREFRGFGRVDQWDTEDFATLANTSDFPGAANIDAASNVPPICTKTWFHTGAFFGEARISKYMEEEYYGEGDSSEVIAGLTEAQFEGMLLDDTVLPTTILLANGNRVAYAASPEELREASRSLRGSILRQEVYGLDGTEEADRPYSVSERNYTIEMLQPQGPNQYAAFFSHGRESIDFQYERKLYKVANGAIVDDGAGPPAKSAADPRVTHSLTLAVDPYGNVLQSATVGYGRRYTDTNLTAPDQVTQSATLSTYSESRYTNAVTGDDVNRNPLPAETSSYELIQVQPTGTQAGITNLFDFQDLVTTIDGFADGLHDAFFENVGHIGLTAGQAYRRLIGRTRTYYRPDDMGAAAGNPKALLGLDVLESLALMGATYKMAFTPGLIPEVFQRGGTALLSAPVGVLGSTAGDGGAYVDLDGDGHWWIPSERTYCIDAAPTTPQEKNQAVQHFYLARRFEDTFGNVATVDFDAYDLLPIATTDAVTNEVTATNDYRVLAPVVLSDPNGNQSAVMFDSLGLVVATAIMGKPGENLGDLLTGFSTELSQATIDSFFDAPDPHTLAGPLIGNATSRVVYDVDKFLNSRIAAPTDPTKWLPAFSATIARETHYYDLAPGQQSVLQISFDYADGFGREIQKKIQAEPGPETSGGPVVNPRWVGSGWTIFNNKGKAVRQYEPFFSQLPAQGHQFEFAAETGVSSILCYDPAGRIVATVHPNHSYEKAVFDPWHQESWDTNDTTSASDPKTDGDVGAFFARLAAPDYFPSWFAQRSGGALGALEQAAATKAAAHANTPTVTYLDSLGRTFLTVLDNAGGNKLPSRVALDIQGNQRAVRDPVVQAGDAQGRVVMRHDFDMQSNRIHQASMEAGERWMLNDATGKAIRAWDSRGHASRIEYDALRRPTGFFVVGTDAVNSDPRTLAGEIEYQQIVYGEGQASDQALNLRTRVFQLSDSSGIVKNQVTDPATSEVVAYDFKGNLLGSSRQFVADYKGLQNWTATSPALLADVFVGTTQYDALNRTTAATTPDGSVVHPTYNEANFLETITVNLRGAVTATAFVKNIDYNAKGQRILIAFGNANTQTAYSYDPLTFRMTNLTTTRPTFAANQQTVQDLSYTYDAVGNVTHIQDDADIQNVVFFQNRRVEPSSDYTYDAIYRLIQAVGREQLGLNGGAPLPPAPTSYNDVPRIGLPSPGDGNAMGTYAEQYNYDQVGNFLTFVHQGANPANPGWTRTYTYNEASLLEAGKVSNRLSNSALSGSEILNEAYTYDPHGNMKSMPQLQAMQWDFKDQLNMTQRQKVNDSDQDGALHQGERTYYVYNAAGERVRKTTESAGAVNTKERFYLGGYEVYREYSGGNTSLERQTLHVMDDKTRVALVETTAIDTSVAATALPTSAIRYQFSNHLGTACLELDETAAVITYEECYPFGSTSYQAGRSAAEVSLKRYRYTGKERDEETGLYYHGVRYYASWLGRWTAADPAGLRAGLNRYTYVSNNPVMLRDPKGMDGEACGALDQEHLVCRSQACPPGSPTQDKPKTPPTDKSHTSKSTPGKPKSSSQHGSHKIPKQDKSGAHAHPSLKDFAKRFWRPHIPLVPEVRLTPQSARHAHLLSQPLTLQELFPHYPFEEPVPPPPPPPEVPEKKTPTPMTNVDVQGGVFGGYDPGSGGGVLMGNLAFTLPHLNPAYHLNEEGGSEDFWGSGRVGVNILSGLGPILQYQEILGAPAPSATSAPLYRSQVGIGAGINIVDLQIRRRTVDAKGKENFDSALVDIQAQAQYFHQFLTDPLGGPTTRQSAIEADQVGVGANIDFHLTPHLSLWVQGGWQYSSSGGSSLSPFLFGFGFHSEAQ